MSTSPAEMILEPHEFVTPRSQSMVHEWSKAVLEVYGKKFLQDHHPHLHVSLKVLPDKREPVTKSALEVTQCVIDLHNALRELMIVSNIADVLFADATKNLTSEWKISRFFGLANSAKGYLVLKKEYEVKPRKDWKIVPEWIETMADTQVRKLLNEMRAFTEETLKKDASSTEVTINNGQWEHALAVVEVFKLATNMVQVCVESAVTLAGHPVKVKVHPLQE